MKILLYIYLIAWAILLLIFIYSHFFEKDKFIDNKNDGWLTIVIFLFAPIVVLAVPFILTSDSKKKNKISGSDKKVLDELQTMFFGGTVQFKEQVSELYSLLNKRYEPGQIANALTWMTMRFSDQGDKSETAIVDEGQMRRPTNVLTREDAVTIYRYVARKTLMRNFPKASEDFFKNVLESLGNNPEGATSNVIPGAYGEYGYDVTNPIPTRGVPTNEIYLKRLRLSSGENFHWERIGSFGAPNIKHPIDGYKIITESGETLCIIYISPYQKIISTQAPNGFYLI